ncbi:hypothetical protein JOC77_002563 [Peribacillus deserti]|uniref:Aspartyl-phosphate phosphatase Spo0E family protein n=1 Tax=Peribacillus deserti TaxID=673318 RepID=A0ABS2QK98_9BACI|nr:aspartyl-phosphate phosphatase Spo0E family protein [Peribacillus deserti]MBM7693124.1 hypothetical protein [Peribacillus deserti]
MNSYTLQKMQNDIQLKRSEMIKSARENGLTHARTIENSQELDELINEYLSIEHTEKKEVRLSIQSMVVILPENFSDIRLV